MSGERTLPGLGLTGFWDTGSDYKTGMDANLLLLSALVQGSVLDSVGTVPGSPTQGDVYRATAAWGGGADKDIMVYDNSSWVALTPVAGWRMFDITAAGFIEFDGTTWATPGSGGSSWYDLRIGFVTTPGADEVIDTIVVPRAVTFAADLSGSVGVVETNATASYVVTVKDDGTSIATITFNTDGSFTFATTGGTSKLVVAGSTLTFVGQTTPDATVANASVTLAGTA